MSTALRSRASTTAAGTRRLRVRRSANPDVGYSQTFVDSASVATLDSEENSNLTPPCTPSGSSSSSLTLVNPAPASEHVKTVLCKWDRCNFCASDTGELAHHICTTHVETQTGDSYVCLWDGCRVYKIQSCSRSWLTRHVNIHTGGKMFKCVIAGCNQSFASQGGLARHVPTHFKISQQKDTKPMKRPDDYQSPSKALKKKRLKYKRQIARVKTEDFFEPCVMDVIKHCLVSINSQLQLDTPNNSHSLVFHSKIVGRRKETNGNVMLLLRWIPEQLIPDVWVTEAQAKTMQTRVIPLSNLPKDSLLDLIPQFYPEGRKIWPRKRLSRPKN